MSERCEGRVGGGMRVVRDGRIRKEREILDHFYAVLVGWSVVEIGLVLLNVN